MPSNLLDPSIFSYLEAKIEEEARVRDDLTQVVQRLDRAVAAAQGLLSRVHSTKTSAYPALITQVESAINEQVLVVADLDKLASQHPYYKYNQKWTRSIQNAIGTVVYCAWLGGFPDITEPHSHPDESLAHDGHSHHGQDTRHTTNGIGRLLTLDQVGRIFSVPANLKDRDAFHLSIEEYLLSLTDLTQDLSRLATNAVVLADFDLPLLISAFVKDLLAGFQLLNLKNDVLRKRSDAVKYDVKRVEDVVYDLSLRGLVNRPE